MPISKTDAFTPDDVELAAWAKALGHPARLAILRTLAQQGTCLCGEVVDELPLAQATVSQHLRALKDAGLIRGEADGPRSCYCLDAPALRRLHEALGALFAGLDCSCACCN
ncbi:MAG: metalloregulator ArsR/SmtB family transcription factor [Rubricoccaceae bacterium]|nr:metalloregulator ArsR/SmtB family transcription factor [Rubricoccaceae bacterium]